MSDDYPLHIACKNKTEKYDIVKKMLEKLRDNSIRKKSNCLQNALDKADSNGQNLLHICIENSHLNLTDLLFKGFYANKEQKEDAEGNFPMHIAAKHGSLEMFKLLIKYECINFHPNKQSENPLHIAAHNNRFKFIRELLKYEKFILENPNENKTMSCVCGCDLSEHKHLVLQKDAQGHTPLHRAIMSSSHKCVVELLNEKNIELDSKDKDSNSVFHLCTECNNTESLKYLLQIEGTQSLINEKNSVDETVNETFYENTFRHFYCDMLKIFKIYTL